MKKHLLKAALLGAAMLLTGCGGQQSSTTVTSSTSTSSDPQYHSVWGDEYGEAIVGNLGIDLPLMPACNFDVSVQQDYYGDPLVIIYCYVDENCIAEALDEYANICIQNGYDVVFDTVAEPNPDNPMEILYYDVYTADKVFTPTKGVELQFLEGRSPSGKECMGIFAYNWTYVNPDFWPTALVEELLTYDIPHPEHHDGYQYFGEIYAEDEYMYECAWIGIKGTDGYDIEAEYAQLLAEGPYEVEYVGYDEETYEYVGYFAYPTDCDDHVIQFATTSYYGLEIMIYRTY